MLGDWNRNAFVFLVSNPCVAKEVRLDIYKEMNMVPHLISVSIRRLLCLYNHLEGKLVLELGDGLGHFTGELAKKACKVIALDFVENVVKENENINGHYENVEFMCTDVTSPNLNFTVETVDLILTYALLSNFSGIEVKDIAEKLLKWVVIEGYIFFTEPCSHQSEDHKQKRDRVFKECYVSDVSGSSYEFSLVETKSIGASGDNKINENQCGLWNIHEGDMLGYIASSLGSVLSELDGLML
ncbi:phosphomethylethanolamine N-methyltransferase-like protein isoform X1 [Tanacetum coccineum]|uniref:phosphoethanolamine N-methyltransferase n=1 Tax=Tanacetum coccineum TaxID=301880 RepID=A0ABQ5BYM9_9ASTR